MTKRKGFKKEGNVFYSVLIGAAISAAIMLALSAITALIINMTSDPLGAADIGSLISLLIGAALSGYVVARRSAESKMLTAVLSSLLFCLMLLLIGLMLGGGSLSGRVFINYLCYIGISTLFAKLGSREMRKHRR